MATTKPISASLARRLAEAADGFRNAKPVFFVAGYTSPYPIKEFDSSEAADDYLKAKIEAKILDVNDYAIFGPYQTIDDKVPTFINEVKTTPGAEDIARVKITITFEDGTEQTKTLEGSMDTIFFNLSSFEKFALPYYCGRFGVEYAKQLRDKLLLRYITPDPDKLKLIHQLVCRTCKTIIPEFIPGEELPK